MERVFKVITFLVIVIVLIGLIGCNNPKTPSSKLKEGSLKTMKLKDLRNKTSIAPDVETAINLLKRERGIFSFSDNGDLILFIGLGQKNTAGYDLEVVSIDTRDDSGIYDIKVKEISPKPGTMVAQVITYPYVLVNLGKAGGAKEIRVTDEQGGQYPTLRYSQNPPRVEKH